MFQAEVQQIIYNNIGPEFIRVYFTCCNLAWLIIFYCTNTLKASSSLKAFSLFSSVSLLGAIEGLITL